MTGYGMMRRPSASVEIAEHPPDDAADNAAFASIGIYGLDACILPGRTVRCKHAKF